MSRKKARIPTAETLLNNGVEDELKKELFREICYNISHDYRIKDRYMFLGTTGKMGGEHRDDRPDYMKESMKEWDRKNTISVDSIPASKGKSQFFEELSKLGGEMTITW